MTEAPTQKILLAEDDEAMRVYLERALTNAGYGVDSVDRGTAALPLLEDGDYDLLLSDIVMPEMDGIELAQRCNEVSPHTKVMFITGFAAVTLKLIVCRFMVRSRLYDFFGDHDVVSKII